MYPYMLEVNSDVIVLTNSIINKIDYIMHKQYYRNEKKALCIFLMQMSNFSMTILEQEIINACEK